MRRFLWYAGSLLAIVVGVILWPLPARGDTVSAERESLIVFAAGPPGSGKNHTLHQLFTSRTPRVVSLDFTAEVRELRNAKAIEVYGLDRTIDTLKRLADAPRWHVAAVVSPSQMPELFTVLAPELRSSSQQPYGRAIGGLAVECGELDLLAPNGRTCEEVAGAYRRCRHLGLSFYGATQRPASCDRLTTATARALIATGTDESIDVKWWSNRLSPAIADVITQLPRHHVVYYDKHRRTVYELDDSYRPLRAFTPAGELLSSA